MEAKEGVNPNAPDVLPSLDEQINQAKTVLENHRKGMKAAKAKHESDLETAKKLRTQLSRLEGSLMNNAYEELANKESQLMAVVQRLESQKTSTVK